MSKNIKNVLLVEDDLSLLRLYTTKLSKTGYTVETATDGEMVFDKLSAFKPDVILLDIIIPKIDGFGVLEKLKKDPSTKSVPVILLTNLGQDEDFEKGKQLGAENYLVKSQFTPTEIVQKMEEVLKK